MSTDKSIREQLHETALKAPHKSGVYLWRNSEGTILYVGKAKSLKNRLSSYFSGQKDIKTRILISRASSIEYIVTENEYEALILENNLIKQHSPRFNIELKDGKTYPLIRITNENFPRVIKTRMMHNDGSQYYGPFPNVNALDTFLEMIASQFPLRHCKRFHKKETPCLYYHIGRCSAPCCEKISKESYMELIEKIEQLLEGNQEEKLKKMTEEMKEAAANFEYEKAARLRDNINAVRILHMKNTVSDFDPDSRDYIGWASEGSLVSFAVLCMRDGRLVSRNLYRTLSLKNDDEIMSEFFPSYYTEKELIPANIFVPPKTDVTLLRRWMKEKFGLKPKITVITEKKSTQEKSTAPQNASQKAASPAPQNASPKSAAIAPRHKAAFNMAVQNAKEDIIRRVRERGDIPALKELQSLLKLDHLPVRIEGFDIAHIHGKFPVASLISFYNGNPDKKNYRYFRLRTTDGIIDDFASMREAATRRYTRLLNEQAELPDLIMIDGGIGQVNAVEGVLSALELDIPIVGLAKRDEELYLPGESTPVCLPKRSDALRLLQRVRDETHRFATSRNQKLRTKENTISRFEKLPHIGKKRARIILEQWRTLENFAEACKTDAASVAEQLVMPAAYVKDTEKAAFILLNEAAGKKENMQNAGAVGMLRPLRSTKGINTAALAGAALAGSSPADSTDHSGDDSNSRFDAAKPDDGTKIAAENTPDYSV